MKRWVLAFAGALSCALSVSACGGSGGEITISKPDSTAPTVSVATSAADAADAAGATDAAGDFDAVVDGGSSFVDGVLTTPEMTIRITESRVIPVGEQGNEYGEKPVIAFWYQITNLTDDDVDPTEWIFVFSAYQDNNPNAVNEIDVASLPDDRFLDSQTETIKKGGTVENAVAYELDDDTTPVDLVATEDLGQTEIGRMTYNLR